MGSMESIFSDVQLAVIQQGYFALLTGFITLWALSWASVIKRDDPRLYRILHILAGGLLIFFFVIGLKLSTKQLFFLVVLTLAIIIVSAEITIWIPKLRYGRKVVNILKKYEVIDNLRDRMDLERNEVLLRRFNGANNTMTRHNLQQACDLIIEQTVPSILKELRIKHKFNVSLLLPNKDGSFKVRSSIGVSPEHIDLIETKFRWIEPVVGLAGYCISRKEKVNVVDFSNPEFSSISNYWVGLTIDEERHTSFYSNPIIFGNPEDEDSVAVAVLCVTVRGKNAWNGGNIDKMMEKVSESIETLLYIEDILQIEDYDIMVNQQQDNPT